MTESAYFHQETHRLVVKEEHQRSMGDSMNSSVWTNRRRRNCWKNRTDIAEGAEEEEEEDNERREAG